jgi:hypothetical protein
MEAIDFSISVGFRFPRQALEMQEEHARAINAPFVFQEEGQPYRIAYDGARLTIAMGEGRSRLSAVLLAANLESFYVDFGARLGFRFVSPAHPGMNFTFRIDYADHRANVTFESRAGENVQSMHLPMPEPAYLYLHDMFEALVFPAPALAQPAAAPQPANEDPVPPNLDPAHGGRRRRRRTIRKRRQN